MKWEEFKPLVEEAFSYIAIDYPHMCPNNLSEDRTRQVPGKFPESYDDDFLEAWEKAGQPHVWEIVQERTAVSLYSIPTYGRIELWQDRGHGWMALYCDNGTGKVFIGEDIVYNDSVTIIGLNEYWGVEEPILFIRI